MLGDCAVLREADKPPRTLMLSKPRDGADYGLIVHCRLTDDPIQPARPQTGLGWGRLRFWPLGAVPLDGVSTAAIEGTADQMWFQVLVYR
jgi:hypothetical protein